MESKSVTVRRNSHLDLMSPNLYIDYVAVLWPLLYSDLNVERQTDESIIARYDSFTTNTKRRSCHVMSVNLRYVVSYKTWFYSGYDDDIN